MPNHSLPVVLGLVLFCFVSSLPTAEENSTNAPVVIRGVVTQAIHSELHVLQDESSPVILTGSFAGISIGDHVELDAKTGSGEAMEFVSLRSLTHHTKVAPVNKQTYPAVQCGAEFSADLAVSTSNPGFRDTFFSINVDSNTYVELITPCDIQPVFMTMSVGSVTNSYSAFIDAEMQCSFSTRAVLAQGEHIIYVLSRSASSFTGSISCGLLVPENLNDISPVGPLTCESPSFTGSTADGSSLILSSRKEQVVFLSAPTNSFITVQACGAMFLTVINGQLNPVAISSYGSQDSCNNDGLGGSTAYIQTGSQTDFFVIVEGLFVDAAYTLSLQCPNQNPTWTPNPSYDPQPTYPSYTYDPQPTYPSYTYDPQPTDYPSSTPAPNCFDRSEELSCSLIVGQSKQVCDLTLKDGSKLRELCPTQCNCCQVNDGCTCNDNAAIQSIALSYGVTFVESCEDALKYVGCDDQRFAQRLRRHCPCHCSAPPTEWPKSP